MSTSEGDVIGTAIRRTTALLVGPFAVAALLSCTDLSSLTAPGEDPPGPGSDPPPAPTLMRIVPQDDTIELAPGDQTVFELVAESPAGRSVTIEFHVDGRVVSTGPRFVFAATEPGRHTIRGVASDGISSTSRQWTVTVARPPNQPPAADLTLDPRGGPAPLSVRLRLGGEDPDGTIDTYRVTGGPDSIELLSDAPIDTTLLLDAGTHAFRGTVVDDRGASSTVHDTVVATRANAAPTPILEVAPDSGQAPLDVFVDVRGSDPDGSIRRYELDLDGDGIFELASRFPIQQSARFTEATEHWVRMRVTDDAAATARDSIRLVVSAAPSTPPPATPNQAPSAAVVATPPSGEAPLRVAIAADASDPDGSVVSLDLDVDGDGAFDARGTDTLALDHVYDTPGTYTIRAVATDDDGASGQATVSVTVTEAAGNEAPSGTLSATVTSGDAPLVTGLGASGSDPDGTVAAWAIDADDGRGWIPIAPGGTLDVTYPFREAPYVPRLRLIDDDGAETIVTGPSIRVFRPVDPGRSTVTARGNDQFGTSSIAPAIWADGVDSFGIVIDVRDAGGAPIVGVPVRLRSLRSPILTPTGVPLGTTESITLDSPTTDDRGRVVARVGTDVSTQVDVVELHTFTPFTLEVEADVGHGTWIRLGETPGLQAVSPVFTGGSEIRIERPRSGGICPGDEITIRITSELRFDAPGAPGPAAGRYTVLRFGEQWIGAEPTAPYADWRTDAAGVIEFRYVPRRADDDRAFRAWIDGVRADALGLLALLDAQDCP